MALIDIILKVDSGNRLKEVILLNESKEWFSERFWDILKGEEISSTLGISKEKAEGIVEIENKFFKYQREEDDENQATIFLSRDGVLLSFYEKTIEKVAEGIQIYDKNGYFLHANSASEALEHYKVKDFKGKHILDLYDLNGEYSTVLTVLRTKKPVLNRCDQFKMKTGKTLTTINSGYPLKIEGKIYGAVVFESDLSVLNQFKNRGFNLEAYVESKNPDRQESLYTFDDIIHTSKSMQDIIHFAKKISLSSSSVLIVGATGTGKELIAQSIHSYGPRRNKPFIDVNCSAIPSNLFESMFFGTERGAFTGSISKKGFFELANGGTLFLDEVNSISLEMQAKLLRVLQERRFQRVGGNKYIHSDVRIIAAANEDIFELIKAKKIRKDFYYRISTIKINILPLCERKEDIPVLVKHFIKRLNKEYGRNILTVSEKVMSVFFKYSWPGNVRELKHVLEYAFNRAHERDTKIKFEHLPDYLQTTKIISHRSLWSEDDILYLKRNKGALIERLKKVETEIIKKTLNENEGNITKSAKQLGISRQSLQYRMRRLGITNKQLNNAK